MTKELFLEKVEEIYREQPDYERGHDGSDGKCDCIGLIKGALRRGGVTPSGLKGTNYAARYTIKNFCRVSAVKELTIGEVVLKAIQPGEDGYDLPDEYKEGGSNYNGDLTDYSHIGVVTGLNPLVITHMTSPTAKKDNKLGKWKYAGWLPQVDGEEPGPTPTPGDKTAKVYAPSGETVNMRKGPSTSKALVERVPIGTVVKVLDEEPDWCQIAYTDKRGATWYGWMMTQFLIFEDTQPAPEPEPEMITLRLEPPSAEELREMINNFMKGYFTLKDIMNQITEQLPEDNAVG